MRIKRFTLKVNRDGGEGKITLQSGRRAIKIEFDISTTYGWEQWNGTEEELRETVGLVETLAHVVNEIILNGYFD